MIKTLSIAISAMVFLLISLFSDPEAKVSVVSSVAPKLTAGEDCLVSVTVTKGDASGYARLQQLLPQGLTAIPVETMGGQFEMEDNLVKLVWQNLPSENSFTVSYKIHTDPNETEVKSLPGTFYYAEGNETRKVVLDPLQLDFSASATKSGKEEVERKIVAITPASGEYKVELTIHRKAGEHTARFIDNIPTGYTVTTINSHGGKFLFSNQQVIFQWAQLPAEPVFQVSYNLNASGPQAENPQVTGMLVYGEDGGEQTNVASASATVTPAAGTVSVDKPSEVIAANLVAEETQKSSPPNMMAYVPAPQKGIFFKIQIAATKKSPVRNDQYFQDKYHFGQHVDLTEYDGWRKYMIGNFDSYISAADFNKRTREKIPDAFVVAYRNAERITIREAMAGNAVTN